jgi:hypothetical protein
VHNIYNDILSLFWNERGGIPPQIKEEAQWYECMNLIMWLDKDFAHRRLKNGFGRKDVTMC